MERCTVFDAILGIVQFYSFVLSFVNGESTKIHFFSRIATIQLSATIRELNHIGSNCIKFAGGWIIPKDGSTLMDEDVKVRERFLTLHYS